MLRPFAILTLLALLLLPLGAAAPPPGGYTFRPITSDGYGVEVRTWSSCDHTLSADEDYGICENGAYEYGCYGVKPDTAGDRVSWTTGNCGYWNPAQSVCLPGAEATQSPSRASATLAVTMCAAPVVAKEACAPGAAFPDGRLRVVVADRCGATYADWSYTGSGYTVVPQTGGETGYGLELRHWSDCDGRLTTDEDYGICENGAYEYSCYAVKPEGDHVRYTTGNCGYFAGAIP